MVHEHMSRLKLRISIYFYTPRIWYRRCLLFGTGTVVDILAGLVHNDLATLAFEF